MFLMYNTVPGKYWKSIQYTADIFIFLLAKQMQNGEV